MKTFRYTVISVLVMTSMVIVGCAEKRSGSISKSEKDRELCPPPASQPEKSTSEIDTDNNTEKNCQNVDEMDFLDCMASKTRCTFGEAIRAVGILLDGKDVGKNFIERFDYLQSRDVVRAAWKLDEDDWIDRGSLSFMLMKSAGIPGGVNSHIFGSWGLGDRRYAYRELLYRNLIESGVDYQYVTGPELVTEIGKIDGWMRENGKYAPEQVAELGDKTQYEEK